MTRVLMVLMLALSFGAKAYGACKINLQPLSVTMSDTQPLISGKINGVQVRFLADSGAFYSTLSPAMANQLKLSLGLAPFGLMVSGVGGMVTPSVATVRQLSIDENDLHNIQFIVGGGEAGSEVAGVLGQNLWGIADVEYDLANGVIRLARPANCGDRPLAYWAPSLPVSRLELVTEPRDFHLTHAYIEVNGVKLKALFDTGASTSFLTYGGAKRAGIDPHGPETKPEGYTRGFGRKPVATRVAPVDLLQIGDEKIEHTHLRLGDTSLEGEDMLLGADFFLSHRVYVANGQRKIYFTYNGGPVFDLRPRQAKTANADREPAAPAPDGATASADAPRPTAQAAGAETLSPSELGRRGAAELGRRDYASAIADLSKAHDLAPREPLYLYQRALAREQSGQPGLALSDLNDALVLAPEDVDALIFRAQMRLGAKARAKGLEDLDAAAKLLADQADLHFALGEIYDRADELASARTQFRLWAKAHPDDARLGTALAGLCWIGAKSGEDLDEALKACDAAVRRGAKNDIFLRSRGLVHLRRGESAAATKDLDAAIQINPKNAWALYGRSLLETNAGKTAEAKADLAAATALAPQLPARARRFGLTPQTGGPDAQDHQSHLD
jgi:tetratricopeptide (TPR) repeat protein/predicted aspartyl protease